METVILVAAAYLCGSIPIGFLLASLAGVDIRARGSGNIGATNVARVVGWRPGILTLLGDALKGFLPVVLALHFDLQPTDVVAVALAAFLGHLYPVFLNFKGGKGVATALGILLALAPEAVLILLVVFVLVAVLSRRVSLASIVAASLAPLVLWCLSYPGPPIALSFLLSFFIILRHRDNIRRLRLGDESKLKINSR